MIKEIIHTQECTSVENIIITTLKNTKIDIKNVSVFYVRRNLMAIWDCRKIKKLIRKLTNTKQTFFFIPHVNNLLSSYLYEYSKLNNIKINIYYEGVALLYDPVVRISTLSLMKRYIIGYISGMGYVHSRSLYPQLLRDKSNAYTPIPEFTENFKGIIKININYDITDKVESNILILTPPIKNRKKLRIFLKNLNHTINTLKNANKITFTFKLHYETTKIQQRYLKIYLTDKNYRFSLLDNNLPIELILQDSFYSKIISFGFSSALINAKVFFKDNISATAIVDNHLDNITLLKIANQLGISVLKIESTGNLRSLTPTNYTDIG
ncbi:hypothetical protein WBJ53_10120 [Spirosoma sp. SC4-14]|uniref:hypothetical protein n=1 Tax=Spirosoma sp. SC4-14 TaxID=3128900 RepID=UPI0030CDF708